MESIGDSAALRAAPIWCAKAASRASSGTGGATRKPRKTAAPGDSSIMGRNLADWNRGMGDAESGRLAASGRSRDYYDGYDYACAVDYEYAAVLPEFAGEGDLSRASGDSAALAASGFSAQLERLNSRLLDSEGASLPVSVGRDAAGSAGVEAAPRDHGTRTTSSGRGSAAS